MRRNKSGEEKRRSLGREGRGNWILIEKKREVKEGEDGRKRIWTDAREMGQREESSGIKEN